MVLQSLSNCLSQTLVCHLMPCSLLLMPYLESSLNIKSTVFTRNSQSGTVRLLDIQLRQVEGRYKWTDESCNHTTISHFTHLRHTQKKIKQRGRTCNRTQDIKHREQWVANSLVANFAHKIKQKNLARQLDYYPSRQAPIQSIFSQYSRTTKTPFSYDESRKQPLQAAPKRYRTRQRKKYKKLLQA